MLAMLTGLVVACMTIMLVWRHVTPPVPDARQRRRQFALPGVDVDVPDAGLPAAAPGSEQAQERR